MAVGKKKVLDSRVLFSSTKLGILTKCPRNYKYMYIDHIKVPTFFVLAFGIAIHRMLELFYTTNFKSEDSFAGFFARYWNDVKYDKNKRIGFVKVPNEDSRPYIFGHYKRLGEAILRNFYKRDLPRRDKFFAEKNEALRNARLLSAKAKKKKEFLSGLGLFPRVETKFQLEFDGHRIRGNIDRIDRFKDGIVFFDYKTDKYKSSSNDLMVLKNPNHQFTVYDLALQNLFPDYELVGRYLLHLRSLAKDPLANPLIPVFKNAVDFNALSISLKNAQDIVDRKAFDRNVGYHCRFCSYYEPCSRDVMEEYVSFPDPVFGSLVETEEELNNLEEKIEEYWGTDLVESNY